MEYDKLYTVGQLAEQLNSPKPRIAYLIAKLQLKEVRRCGIIRLFSGKQLDEIRKSLNSWYGHTLAAG